MLAGRRSLAGPGLERHVLAADGRSNISGGRSSVRTGRANSAGRRPMAVARDENADVRHGQAVPDGDEIYCTRTCRDEGDQRPGLGERYVVDIHDSASEGRADDPAESDHTP